MKIRPLYLVVFAALGINLLIGASVYLNAAQSSDEDSPYQNIRLFTEVLNRLHDDYVDAGKTSYQELVRAAINGMFETLDPHSEFMLPVEHDNLRSDTEGEFGGVGIVVEMRDGFLTVVSPIDNTPGFRAGIIPGERIVSIDGVSTENLDLREAVTLLRGRPGSEVTIGFYNPETDVTRDVPIERAVIQVDTVKDLNGGSQFNLLRNDVGYVRLIQFGEKTSDELENALRTMESKGMKSLVLDLRGNPGGLLSAAVEICEQFLPRNELIVTTEGRNGVKEAEYRSRTREEHRGLPIVALVNGGSASASEIVSGCLQDLGRAVILGEKTFGKGSVQSILPAIYDHALRLTTAYYYTPSHKVIHEQGITPDIVVEMSVETERDLMIKRTPGRMESLPDAERERLEQVKDVQLERAIDLLSGMELMSSRFMSEPEQMVQR